MQYSVKQKQHLCGIVRSFVFKEYFHTFVVTGYQFMYNPDVVFISQQSCVMYTYTLTVLNKVRLTPMSIKL